MEFKHICMIGLGYIGLPTAATFARNGIKVTGVDNNPDVIDALRHGHVHIYEPGLGEMVAEALKSGNLGLLKNPSKRMHSSLPFRPRSTVTRRLT